MPTVADPDQRLFTVLWFMDTDMTVNPITIAEFSVNVYTGSYVPLVD